MKKLFATHKILSIIVAVAIIMSGLPLSAAATTADADTATAGVTSADNTAIGLSGEIEPDNAEPADTDQEEQQDEQEPDPVDDTVATSGVTVNNDGESCVCTAFQSDPDCPVCKDDAAQCFFYYCVCEALCGEDSINPDCPVCKDDYTKCVMAVEPPEIAALAAQALPTSGTLSGDYEVTIGTTITTTGLYTISGTVTITGGGTIKRGFIGHLITVPSGASLTLNSITIDGGNKDGGAYVTNSGGSLVNISSGGALTMKTGATLQNNTTNVNNGGGVLNSGTFTMDGGTISGNTTTSYSSGGVSNIGTFTMNSGKISGNTTQFNGGSMTNSGTFTMNGGEISGNTAGLTGGGVYNNGTFTVGGTAKIKDNTKSGGAANNVYLYDNKYITLGTGASGADTPTSGMEIGVGIQTGYSIIVNSGADASHVQYFKSDAPAKMVELSGVRLMLADKPKVYVSNGGNDSNDGLTTTTPFLTIAQAYSVVPSGGEILVMGPDPLTVNPIISLTGAKTVTLKSDGATAQIIKRGVTGNLITVNTGVTLILENITIDGGNKDSGGAYETNGGGSLVTVEYGGTLTMNNGAVLQNNTRTSGNGGGVFINGGAFNMNDGEISGNSASAFLAYGGGVLINNGNFTMNGGKISNNTTGANGVGGVYVFTGTFTVGGNAKIENNTANGNPANVSLANNQYITLGTPAAGMEIYVTKLLTLNDGVFVNSGATQAMVDNNYFKSDDTTKKVELDGDKLKLVTALSPVTITGVSATSRAYNGTTTVALTGGTLSGVDSGDDVGFTLGSGTMADANAGTSKAVTTAITLTGGDANKYTLAQPTNVTVNITPKALTISGVAATDRTYNGTTAVALTGTGTLSGIESGDIGSVSAVVPATGTIANANVGTSKAVTTAITLTGGKAGNYTLTQPTVTVDITKKDININTVEALTKTYDGNMSATAGAVTFSGMENSETLTLNTDYSVTAAFTDNANAGIAKQYTYTVAMGSTAAANNYNLTGNTKTGSNGVIGQSTTLDATAQTINILSTDTAAHTFNLNDIVLNKTDCGTRSYALNGGLGGTTAVLNGSPTLGGTNNATLTYKGAGLTSGSAMQSITITTTNYTNITVTITFTATVKNNVSTSITFANGTATYDGTVKTHENAQISGYSGGTWTYTYTAVTGILSGGKPLTAGTYTVTAKYEDTTNIGTETANFTINKATPSYTVPTGLTAIYGQNLADVNIAANTGFSWMNNSTSVGAVGSRTHQAKFTPTDTNNYNTVDNINVNVAVSAKAATNLTIAAISAQTYTGSALTPVLTVTDSATPLTLNTDYTVAYTNNMNAGTATATITGKGNYTGTKATTFTISKANYGDKTATATVRAGKTTANATLALPVLPAGANYPSSGTVSDATFITAHSITFGTLKYSAAGKTNGTSATITIPVTNATNYNSYNVVVTITAQDPTDAVKVADDLDALTFNDIKNSNVTERDITGDLTLITTGNAYSSTITWASSNTSIIGINGTVTKPTDGDKTVTLTATVTNGSASGTKTFTLTVKKAPASTGGVGGTVTDSGGTARDGYTVKIMTGGTNGTLIGTTTTASGGIYSFTGLPYGVYSLVVDDGANTVTRLITINKPSFTEPVITMPSGNQNTNVEVKGNETPSVAVENLEAVFTTDDVTAAQTGSVEIKLIVEAVTNPADATIVLQNIGGKELGFYLDAKLIKTVSGNSGGGTVNGTYDIQPPSGTKLTIVIDVPPELQNMAPYLIIRVHNGVAATIPADYDSTLHTLTFEADAFSTYALAYTPKTPNPPSPPTPSGAGGSSGGSGGGGGTGTAVVSTYWIEVAEAKAMAKAAKTKELDYVRSHRAGITGIRKNALLALAKDSLRYQHDTVAGNAVQVRVYIDEPSKAVKDILVSGYIKGDTVDKTKARFEKWFTNKVAVVSLDAQGDFGMQVQIAAKVDLTGMDTNKLYFYSYDKKANKYNRIQTEYRIDANGYLHFATILAGDIIVSSGPLTKKTEQQIAAGGNKYNYLAAHSIQEITNNVGGDSIPDVSEPLMQETPQTPSTEGDSLLYMDTADTPLKLKKVDNQNIGGALVIDLDAPDALAGSQNRKPSAFLIGGIAALVLLAAVILWAIVPRKDDVRVSDEEYREKQ